MIVLLSRVTVMCIQCSSCASRFCVVFQLLTGNTNRKYRDNETRGENWRVTVIFLHNFTLQASSVMEIWKISLLMKTIPGPLLFQFMGVWIYLQRNQINCLFWNKTSSYLSQRRDATIHTKVFDRSAYSPRFANTSSINIWWIWQHHIPPVDKTAT